MGSTYTTIIITFFRFSLMKRHLPISTVGPTLVKCSLDLYSSTNNSIIVVVVVD